MEPTGGVGPKRPGGADVPRTVFRLGPSSVRETIKRRSRDERESERRREDRRKDPVGPTSQKEP